MSPHRLQVLDRQWAAGLDGQVGNAPVRIEHPRLDEGSGRTRLQASRAAAALFEPLRVGLEGQRADDLREKQPRSDLRVDQAAVLADPAEPGVLRVDALLH